MLEFENQIIAQNLIKIEAYLDSFLLEKGILKSDIDVVFMTGGTSLIKPLNQIFKNKFGSEKLKSGDNFNSVAMGLAYSYLNLN